MEKNAVELGLPDGLELYNRGFYLEIVRKWFGLSTIVVTAFAAVFDWWLFKEYTKWSTNAEPLGLELPLFTVVVIALNYYAVAKWFNRTHIFVSQGKVAVQHRPLPFFGSVTLSASDLKQLYAKEDVSRGRGRESVSYEVHAVTHSGRNINLVDGLDTSEQAFFVEQQIEKYLGIKDAPVKGELGGESRGGGDS